jgi:hypothetical protein
VFPIALLLYYLLEYAVNQSSLLQRNYLVILNIRDSKLYVSFSIGSKSLALLRHYVLSLRSRFCNVCRALSRVERLVVNYVITYSTTKLVKLIN